MFRSLVTLKTSKTCTYCGQELLPGEEVVCEYTLLGRRFYHKPCYFDMAMALAFVNHSFPCCIV